MFHPVGGRDCRRRHGPAGPAPPGAYIRWRNREALPKQGFAINSTIRGPDCRANQSG
ncbi:hypothetical protein Lfu02_40300 [Longispora fulva]|nr:hypothetical protein Lfu02_40300 [Longispora fulva]